MANYFPQQQQPTSLGGQLPWGQGGGDMFSQDMGSAYKSAYNSALAQNQANYSNILSGYQRTLADQGQAQEAIGRGYSGLYNDVMGRIQGIDASQRQAIQDSYAAQQGQAQQSMISRGLGNATVSDSVQRGLVLDRQKADIALSNQTAQLQAGYAGQIGGAALNYAGQASAQNTALQAQQLGWMNSVNAPYPNVQAYAQLLQQQGVIDQANRDRQQQQSQFEKMMAAAQSARGGGGGGMVNYPPAPTLGHMNPGGSAGYSPQASVTPFGMGGSGTPLPSNFSMQSPYAPMGMPGSGTGPTGAALGSLGGMVGGMAPTLPDSEWSGMGPYSDRTDYFTGGLMGGLGYLSGFSGSGGGFGE